MNHERLIELRRQKDEIDAALRDDMQRHSDDELARLVTAFLDDPAVALAMCMGKPDKLMALAAVPLQLERLRRAEVAAMDAENEPGN